MSNLEPFSYRSKGRRPAALRMPDEGAWPLPDTLINRRQLAELYGVTVPVIRGWERRGKGPRKVAQPPRDGFSEVLCRCADVREWLEKEIAKQRATEPTHATPYRSLSPQPLSGKDVVQLARLEAQVNALPPEPPPPPPIKLPGCGWLTPEDDEPFEPFPCHTRTVRPGRYW